MYPEHSLETEMIRLRRIATENIEGRASFERHFNMKSEKPLTRVEVDPRALLEILDRVEN